MFKAGRRSGNFSGHPVIRFGCSVLFSFVDSVSRNVDLKAITDATKSTIVTARAYNAVHDDVANIAKDAAFYPRKNFSAVVPTEVVKDEFDHLILQAGSVDITNLKTKENANSHLDYFRQ